MGKTPDLIKLIKPQPNIIECREIERKKQFLLKSLADEAGGNEHQPYKTYSINFSLNGMHNNCPPCH